MIARTMRNRKRNPRRGAVAVEMAITLPILFLFVFTSIEFARMNVIRHTVDNAAYEAARRAIVPGATAADADSVARSILSTVGTKGITVTVTPAVIRLDSPEVRVDISVACDQNGFITPVFFKGKQLTGRSTLRREAL